MNFLFFQFAFRVNKRTLFALQKLPFIFFVRLLGLVLLDCHQFCLEELDQLGGISYGLKVGGLAIDGGFADQFLNFLVNVGVCVR